MPLIFQYGSNCDEERLNCAERLSGAAEGRGRAQTVDEYDIAFDVWSQTNRCAAADLIAAPRTGRQAWGVLYEVPADRIRGRKRPDGKRTLEEIEGPRYEEKQIRVRNEAAEEVEATTFLVKPAERRYGLWTSCDYVCHVVRGLRAHSVEEQNAAYIQHVIDVAIEANSRAAQTAGDHSARIEALRAP